MRSDLIRLTKELREQNELLQRNLELLKRMKNLWKSDKDAFLAQISHVKLKIETWRRYVVEVQKANAFEVAKICDSFETKTATLTTKWLDERRALVDKIESLREKEQFWRSEYYSLYEERERVTETVWALEEKLALSNADGHNQVDQLKVKLMKEKSQFCLIGGARICVSDYVYRCVAGIDDCKSHQVVMVNSVCLKMNA